MEKVTSKNNIFNSKVDVGLRLLFLLSEINKPLDLQSIIYLDYLMLHSGEISSAPESMHTTTKIGSGEILVKRDVTKSALIMMHQNQLIDVKFLDSGVYYSPNKLTKVFIKKSFISDYSTELKVRAKWIKKKFYKYDEEKLKDYIDKNVSKWDVEFTEEKFI
jgi:hypothetical protein